MLTWFAYYLDCDVRLRIEQIVDAEVFDFGKGLPNAHGKCVEVDGLIVNGLFTLMRERDF
jgi:hypothetical protein